MSSSFVERFASKLESIAEVEVGGEILARFDRYYRILVDWNERMNLTAITEVEAVYWKHFFDSAMLLTVPQFNRQTSLLDVGAGAGFPSVPVHILCPELRVTVLDSLQKRISFLKELAGELQLANFSAFHGRAEDFGQDPKWRESYDQVTARALARLPILLELCLPFVKVGGYFFAMKGPDGEAEASESEKALQILGGKIEDILKFDLKEIEGTRTVVVVRKVSPTPETYPRKAGTPSKKPLL
ncbi:16S rRNA (guanine(527)-N(7))-methyltransferase RsmG [Effusibacillus lacus]|uniref:Ribosomal RNA small subunit methyltransferase G n=1 Tax=Effusibacillus lacus TaxID=1348429 RepID=A0A292YJ10_9BACL|nr:16S rRNA (guanine(527)-N(7))-methyltransferase RsmG [Effusibacillus lacus]TCS75191.1 16S rRNA m(7)G-527 methyltransferase [Effusibacillus lacus]GAX89136.1 16S rRNA methyltransferase G [Effusibacillus lacus]